jgi:hypothetical protein
MALDCEDLRGLPLSMRKTNLARLFAGGLALLSVELLKPSPIEQHHLSLCLPFEPQNFFGAKGRERA